MFLLRQSTDRNRQDRDDTWKKCRANDPDVRLSACSELIDAGNGHSPPSSQARYYARGNAYRQKSLFALALEDFNAAITANPALSDAYGDRGITLTILGRFADAIPDFTRVIETYPQLAYAHYNRGTLLRAARSRRSRDRGHHASIEIEPQAEFRFERRGTIYFRKNLLDKALADYEEALVINPQYASALYGRGIIRTQERRSRGRRRRYRGWRHITGRTSQPKWPVPASSDASGVVFPEYQAWHLLHKSSAGGMA